MERRQASTPSVSVSRAAGSSSQPRERADRRRRLHALLGSKFSREYLLHAGICSKYDQAVRRGMKQNRSPQAVCFLYQVSPDQRQSQDNQEKLKHLWCIGNLGVHECENSSRQEVR